jgi:sec-independent protein translocase protein TatB
MLDFSFGELAMIGTVALVVLGPERLPKVARTVGDWVGKAQRYVNQVKSDINREMELAELKKLQEEAQSAARSIESSVQGLQSDLHKTAADLNATGDGPAAGSTVASSADYAWEGAGESWQRHVFERRYKPGPSVDDLAEEIARLKHQLAMPELASGRRRKYTPRARMNRPRIRR